MKIKLRDYQEKAIKLTRKAFSDGHRRIMIFMATGAGKSVVFLSLISSLLKNKKRVIFLVKRRQLTFQAREHFSKNGISSSMLMGNEKGYDINKDLQICSIDTVTRRNIDLSDFDFFIIDEGHDFTASSYSNFLEKYKEKSFISLTATPFAVGKKAHTFWDACVKPIEMEELKERGYLVPCALYVPHQINLTNLKIDQKSNDYQTKALSNEMSKLEIVGDIINDYIEIGKMKPALCFCVDKNHSIKMAQEFNEAGIPALHCDESTKQKDRDNAIRMLKDGRIKVLCNINIFSTGVDIPEAEVGIMARPTRSEILWIQQVGRLFRPYRKCGKCHKQYDNSPKCPHCGYDKPSYIKKTAIIIDSGDNQSRLGHPYDERLPVMNEEDKKARSEREKPLSKTCKFCYAVYKVELKSCPYCNKEMDLPDNLYETKEGKIVPYDEFSELDKYFKDLKRSEVYKNFKPTWKYFQMYKKYGDKCMKYQKEFGIPKWIPLSFKKSKLKQLEGKLYT